MDTPADSDNRQFLLKDEVLDRLFAPAKVYRCFFYVEERRLNPWRLKNPRKFRFDSCDHLRSDRVNQSIQWRIGHCRPRKSAKVLALSIPVAMLNALPFERLRCLAHCKLRIGSGVVFVKAPMERDGVDDHVLRLAPRERAFGIGPIALGL